VPKQEPPVPILSRGTGYRVDDFDHRDHDFENLSLGGMSIPDEGSVAHFVRVIHNQSWTNSCVAQAIETAFGARRMALGDPYDPVSRSYLWFNAKAYAGTQTKNVGCMPRLALRGFQKLGGSLESSWPFSASPLAVYRRPPWLAYATGYKNRGSEYLRISKAPTEAVKAAIDAKFPVVVGLEIGKSFKKHDGITPLDPPSDVIGRHMVTIVGYDRDSFEIVNSWGRSWGSGGFGRISKAYLETEGTHDLYTLL